jgi:membrane fusion protein, multidrug efflux system
MKLRTIGLLVLAAVAACAQSVETVKVRAGSVDRLKRLPGELQPFLKVTVEARVNGFVESVNVDRGSRVKSDQLLVRLSAPELAAKVAEAEAKVRDVQSRAAEAEARLAAAKSTYERLKEASQTPGVVAANDLYQAQQQVRAAEAFLKTVEVSSQAALAAVAPLRDLESYLLVKAPFEGVITERLVHPGALVGPGTGKAGMLVLEQVSRLRLVVAVPERETGSIPTGAQVKFSVPAYPGKVFTATIARVPHSLDAKIRSMLIEADVENSNGALAPGMYAEVEWPVARAGASLLVPPTAVATTTERSFVIRVKDGKAEWVDVTKGSPSGDLVEVVGALAPGDEIVKRASDEIRNGSRVQVK